MSTLIWKILCVALLSFHEKALICQCRAFFWPSRLFGGTFLTFEGRLLVSEQIFIDEEEKLTKQQKIKVQTVFLALLKNSIIDELATLIWSS